jgi:minor extracellular serine protease Vpr
MRGAAGRRALVGAALACALVASPAGAVEHEPATVDEAPLYLVTLDGPGLAGYGLAGYRLAGYRGDAPAAKQRARLVEQQDALLSLVHAEPVYRWTTALNGFAVHLDDADALLLAALPQVTLVQRDEVRRVAGRATTPGTALAPTTEGRGGRGVVIGVVDTGLDPDGPVFATSPRLGPVEPSSSTTCPDAEGWEDACTGKVVAGRHFVEGFGADRLGTGATLSPRDDVGHGTQVASLTAGDAQVTARNGEERLGRFSGIAPDARLAVYKACWTAPEPADDGCSTADLVAAIDRAVADGVDVLTVAVTGTPRLDTVDLALLGAAEDDVFVAAAAGNGVTSAGHAQPWVTTVGSATGPRRLGRLTAGAHGLTGVMTSTRRLPATPVVDAAHVPAPGWSEDEARLCVPGSLDAARVAGRIVVCDRGSVARVDKSAAVELADGVGLVLVSGPGEGLASDFHAVPTLHVSAAGGAELRRWLAEPGRLDAILARIPATPARPRVSNWSPAGTPRGTVKPDLVARGSSLLAATTPAAAGRRWDLLTGTSASTAVVAGLAARIRSAQPHWSAAWVRSALTTTATDAADADERQGAGLVVARAAVAPGLVHDLDPAAYRRVLEGDLPTLRLNLPGAVVPRSTGTTTFTRRLTRVGTGRMYFSSEATGFRSHRVTVGPAAIRIGRRDTVTYQVTVAPLSGVRPQSERGWVSWRGADGTRVRIPVVLR